MAKHWQETMFPQQCFLVFPGLKASAEERVAELYKLVLNIPTNRVANIDILTLTGLYCDQWFNLLESISDKLYNLNKIHVVQNNNMAAHLFTFITTLLFSTFVYQFSNSLPVVYQESTINSDPNILARDETSAESKDNKICVTKQCTAVSASIKAAINEEVKPCDDFYDYACGEWMKNNPIPKGKIQISAFTELRDKNNEIMREALVNDDTLNDLLPIKKVRTFFQSCLNVEAIDKLGNEPIRKYIKDLDSWAVDEKTGWESGKWDVFKTLKKIQKKYTSTNLFFSVESVPDPLRNGTEGKNILMVISPACCSLY
jgi:hypothetical protein